MISLTANRLERPQRVRQFFVPQQLESFSTETLPQGADVSITEEGQSSPEDLPCFLRNRSLRRRLDAAFDACYQHTMTGWLLGLFRKA